MPCNIVLQQRDDGRVEISTVEPISSVPAITHVVVDQVAGEIRSDLERLIDEIGNATETAGASKLGKRIQQTTTTLEWNVLIERC